MKAHLDKSCTLVITPETYEEKFALDYWSKQAGVNHKMLIKEVDPEAQYVIYNKDDGKKREQ